jgi:hypothetical protein
MDMVYHTSSRNAFCDAWKKTNGRHGEILFNRIGHAKAAAFLQQSIPRGPTASAYLAYLQSSNMADSIYAFTNRLDHGAKDAFVKVHPDVERERHLALAGGPETAYLHRTAFDESGAQQQDNDGVTHATTSVRRVLQAEDLSGLVEANLFDWLGSFFKRFFRIIADDEDDEAKVEAEEEAPATTTEEPEQEPGSAQVNRAGGTPSFSSRTKGGGGGGGGGGKCAAEGAPAKSCGASDKGISKDCCATLGCDPNGSGLCVSENHYGGGEVVRGLVMESPGWLVHSTDQQDGSGSSSRGAETQQEAAIDASTPARRGWLRGSVPSFLGGMLNALGL